MNSQSKIPSGKKVSKRKSAETIAMQIEEDIIQRGWKVGESLGKESDLVERYEVGRWIIREALGIVEQDGLIEIRRGRNGGIIISKPAIDAVGMSIHNYLRVCDISPDEIFQARLALETLVIIQAHQHVNEKHIVRLRELFSKAESIAPGNILSHMASITTELLLASGNVALQVFTYALTQITADRAASIGLSDQEYISASEELINLRFRQFEAILSGDFADAHAKVEQFLNKLREIGLNSPRSANEPSFLTLPNNLLVDPTDEGTRKAARPKLSEQLSRQIQSEIIFNNLPVGHHLGTERELMEKYNLSRAVFREAVRPLERLGVLEMRQGRESGLKVSQPEPSSVIRSVARFLNYADLSHASILDVLRTMEGAIVKNVSKLPESSRAEFAMNIRSLAEDSPKKRSIENSKAYIRDVYLQVSNITDNKLLSFFLRILVETLLLSNKGVASKKRTASNLEKLTEKTLELAEVINSADDQLARLKIYVFHQVAFEND